MSRLEGTLLGFGDFFEEVRVIGAVVPPKPPAHPPGKVATKTAVKVPMAKPKRTYPAAKHNPDMEKHGQILAKGQKTATKAVQVLSNAAKLLHPKSSIPLRPVHIGAAAAAAMTPKQTLAVKKHNAAVVKSNAAAKALAAKTAAAQKSLGALAKQMVAQRKAAAALRTPSRKGSHVGMDVIGAAVQEAFHDYYSMVGALPDPRNRGYLTDGTDDPACMMGVDASGLSPGMPGYDPTSDPSSPSYAYGTGMGGTDANGLSPGMPGYDPTTDPTSASYVDPSTTVPGMDPALTDPSQLPPAPGMDNYIPDMTAVGGIAYNGAKGTPQGYVGSYGLFTRATDHSVEPDTVQIDGTEHWGYVWGTYDKNGAEGGIPWGSNLQPGVWNHIHGRFHLGDSGWHDVVDATEAYGSYQKSSTSQTQQNKQSNYGPLVGNPVFPDFAHMRVDGQGNMFWFPQEAPDWLTFPVKQAAALTAQATAKAAADAQAADAAAAQKAAADAAAAQAQQDAANALAESQAQSQYNVSQLQSESDANAALVQQQQADTAQQMVDTSQQKQAGDLMVQQIQQQMQADQQAQQLQMQLLQQHPELLLPDQGGGGGGGGYDPSADLSMMPGMDNGGGEGAYDDGTPIPGGDVMSDADGDGYDDGNDQGNDGGFDQDF